MTNRVEVWGASWMIEITGKYDYIFLSPPKGLRAPQGMMDRLDVPHPKYTYIHEVLITILINIVWNHSDGRGKNNPGEMRLGPRTAEYRAVPEQKELPTCSSKEWGCSRTELQKLYGIDQITQDLSEFSVATSPASFPVA